MLQKPGFNYHFYAFWIWFHILSSERQKAACRSGASELCPARRRSLYVAECLGAMGGYELLTTVLLRTVPSIQKFEPSARYSRSAGGTVRSGWGGHTVESEFERYYSHSEGFVFGILLSDCMVFFVSFWVLGTVLTDTRLFFCRLDYKRVAIRMLHWKRTRRCMFILRQAFSSPIRRPGLCCTMNWSWRQSHIWGMITLHHFTRKTLTQYYARQLMEIKPQWLLEVAPHFFK